MSCKMADRNGFEPLYVRLTGEIITSYDIYQLKMAGDRGFKPPYGKVAGYETLTVSLLIN